MELGLVGIKQHRQEEAKKGIPKSGKQHICLIKQ